MFYPRQKSDIRNSFDCEPAGGNGLMKENYTLQILARRMTSEIGRTISLESFESNTVNFSKLLQID